MSGARIDGDAAVVAAIHRLHAERGSPLLVALDGRSGAGKSTVAARLAGQVDGVVIEGDDFYAGGADAEWAARTAAAKVAGCIDWRRLRTEALEPLLAGRPADYRPFDFATGTGLAAHTIRREPAPLILLDGVYSGRPELADLVDLAVLVELPDNLARRRRLVAREGPLFMTAWHALWDEAEDYYFTHIRPPATFDLVVTSV
jgi:uridine kinase